MPSFYGIKQRSCVNSLKYFHVADGLPPDIVNDIFQGIAIYIACNIITSLVSEGKSFSTDFASSKLASIEYSQINERNKPQPFTELIIVYRIDFNSRTYSAVFFKVYSTF